MKILLLTLYFFFTNICWAVSADITQQKDLILFDVKKESTYFQLSNFSLQKCFELLNNRYFLIKKELQGKAISIAFSKRKNEAIEYAINQLNLPIRAYSKDKFFDRTEDFYVAKQVLQFFSVYSVEKLLKFYWDPKTDATTKGNIILVLGTISNGQAINDLLFEALIDHSNYEEWLPNLSGDPLRVCDISYNQLVLRNKIKNALRVIGNQTTIENRNFHIKKLIKQYSSGR